MAPLETLLSNWHRDGDTRCKIVPLPDLPSVFKGQIFRCIWLWPNPASAEALGNF